MPRVDETRIAGRLRLNERPVIILAVVLIPAIMRAEGKRAPRGSIEAKPQVTRLAGEICSFQKYRFAEDVLRSGELLELPDRLLFKPCLRKKRRERNFRVSQGHQF